MLRPWIGWAISGVAGIAIVGTLLATTQQRQGAVLIAGDRPVTEDQIRDKLQSDGYSHLQILRQGRYFEVLGSKDGQTGKILVDSQTGRLAADDDDDD
jgi:hypothetical protein